MVFSELTVLLWPSCRPQPPTQNMNLGPGALAQSGSSQGLHSQGGLSDAVGSGLPPPSLLQGQIGNGEPGAHGRASGFGLLPRTVASWLPGAQQPQQGAPHPLAPSGLGGSAAARSGGGVQRRKPSGRVGATSDQGLGLHSTFWQERRAPGRGWGPAVAPGALTKGLSPLPEGARGGAVRPSALHGLKAPGPSPLQVRATWPCSRRRRARCPPRP